MNIDVAVIDVELEWSYQVSIASCALSDWYRVSDMSRHRALARATEFCETSNLRLPILMAPMAGASPVSLAVAIANAGGLAGCGALLMEPDAIRNWASDVRAGSNGGFQLNLWIPDPPPKRDAAAEDAVRRFLSIWGPEVAREAGDVMLPNFESQCEAMLETGPAIISSIMGLYPERVSVTHHAQSRIRSRSGCRPPRRTPSRGGG